MRDLQVWWESLLLDFSTTRLFHGLGLLFSERRQELSLRTVVSDTVSSDGESKCCVRVLMDDHLASGHGATPFGRLDLQNAARSIFYLEQEWETLVGCQRSQGRDRDGRNPCGSRRSGLCRSPEYLSCFGSPS